MKNKKFFSFGFGRRKCSVAEVIIFPGKGIYHINFINYKFYFQNNKDKILQSFLPLKILNIDKDFNVIVSINGGGLENQTKAISLSIARAISNMFPFTRKLLKHFKLLKYDKRIIERKKYGLKKARKASQYSKR